MKESDNPHRIDIQVMRGIAVVAVLLFHAKKSMFPLGYLGVDVFFVISGFVVTPMILRIFPQSDTHNRKETLNRLRSFFVRRFFRLAPAMGTSLILGALLVLIFSPNWANRNFPHQALATLLLMGNWGAFTFVGDYFEGSASPIVHTWSLSAEMQIYILLPLFIFLLSLLSRSFRKTSILQKIISVGIVSFITHFAIQVSVPKYFNSDPDVVRNALFYSPISRFWEFALGALAYALSVHRVSEIKFRKNLNSLMLLVGTLISLIYFLLLDVWPLIATLTTLGVIYFKILLKLPNVLVSILAWLGDRSYSIYLVHLPLMYVAKNSPLFGDIRRQILVGLALIASIAVGSWMFNNIENKFRLKNTPSMSKKTILKTFAIFVLAPLLSFSSLDFAIAKNYWGAMNINSTPTEQAVIGKSCEGFNARVPCVNETGTNPNKIINILVGDSHADSLSTVYEQVVASRSESYAVWTKGNCPFILRETVKDVKYKEVLASLSLESSGVSCLRHNQEILEYASSRSSIRVWVSNRNTQGYKSTYSWNLSNDQMRRLIEDNLKKLAASSLKVIFVGPIPEKIYGDEPNKRLLWKLPQGSIKNFRIEKLPAGPFDDNLFFSKSIFPINVAYINPINIFCDAVSCFLGKDNQFYSDAHHLNISGSKKLEESMKAASK